MPAPRWERRKQARPAELTNAALQLFVERGYAATRLDDVARQAGVSKGTVYLYFASKEELFKAVVREGIVPVLERGEQIASSHPGNMADLLRDLIKGWWEWIGNTPYGGIPKLMFSESRNFPDLARFYYEEVIRRGHRLIEGVIRRGIQRGEFRPQDPEYVARLLTGPVVLLAIWRHSFDFCESHAIDPARYLDRHVDLLLDGLRPRTVGSRKPARPVRRRAAHASARARSAVS
jgi:AcrR family transcriptional regulator